MPRYAYYFIDDVSIEEVLIADAGTDQTICPGDSVDLGNNVTTNASYSWYPVVGLSDSLSPNPKAAPTVSTMYYVNKKQCNVTTRDSVLITVKTDCTPKNILIPTLITSGQYWQIQGFEAGTQVEVFNLLGQLTFSSQDYSNNLSADLVSPGVYLYRIRKIDGEIIKGKFTVIR
jgi:hypothetical protein